MLLALATTAVVADPAAAQSRSRFSVQASSIALTSNEIPDRIVSGEAQVRMTFGRLSVGLGVAQSNFKRLFDIGTGPLVYNYTLTDIFIEPRYVVTAFGPVGLYVAGRVAPSGLAVESKPLGGTYRDEGTENNFVFGGGGGALLRITDRIAGDIGLQYYGLNAKSGDGTERYNFIQGRLGISIGLGN
jgi:opacity protein-like surface antigen